MVKRKITIDDIEKQLARTNVKKFKQEERQRRKLRIRERRILDKAKVGISKEKRRVAKTRKAKFKKFTKPVKIASSRFAKGSKQIASAVARFKGQPLAMRVKLNPLKKNILSPTVFSTKFRQTIEEGKTKTKASYFRKGRL